MDAFSPPSKGMDFNLVLASAAHAVFMLNIALLLLVSQSCTARKRLGNWFLELLCAVDRFCHQVGCVSKRMWMSAALALAGTVLFAWIAIGGMSCVG